MIESIFALVIVSTPSVPHDHSEAKRFFSRFFSEQARAHTVHPEHLGHGSSAIVEQVHRTAGRVAAELGLDHARQAIE
jgi:hypothetical protein